MNVSPFRPNRALARSAEVRRIEALPRRSPTPDPALAESMTEVLKRDGGTMKLRPVQAQALHELGTYGGLFGPIRVGGGKTLISLLAPYVLEARRPILLLPAALVEKTERERRELCKHWRIPSNLRILSYETLSRIGSAEALTHYRPDLIIADEAHKLKNKRAGVTKRVVRWMREHPETRFVAISGTMIKHSLKDFAHLLTWSHKEGAPVPHHEGELEEWCAALDEKVNPLSRIDPGPLAEWEPEAISDRRERGRRGFHRRLVETPAVVVTSGESVDCSLYIRGHLYNVNPITEANFQTLRGSWETPDGWALSEAVAVWRHARELALGFHYVWDPRPPREWLEARKAWAAFVRETLAHSRKLDTELQVAGACARGELSTYEFHAWQEIRPTFTINQKAVWHDESALESAEHWLSQGPGIAWCEHTFFAEELSRRTGLPYYGAEGKDRRGNPIEDAKGPIIASVAANGTGRNLQRWNRNLITSCPSTPHVWEQLIGRTHRDGQDADEVIVDVLLGCAEHFTAWEQATSGACYARDALGQPQKILDADRDFPELPKSGVRFAVSSYTTANT